MVITARGERRGDEGETETFSSEYATCPYCGHDNNPEDSDGLLYDESTDEYDCNDCGKTFWVTVNVTYFWTCKERK
jgi:transposase-like protein